MTPTKKDNSTSKRKVLVGVRTQQRRRKAVIDGLDLDSFSFSNDSDSTKEERPFTTTSQVFINTAVEDPIGEIFIQESNLPTGDDATFTEDSQESFSFTCRLVESSTMTHDVSDQFSSHDDSYSDDDTFISDDSYWDRDNDSIH